MLHVAHELTVPHPLAAVLAQYVDLEHIEAVHPDTVGRYEAVAVEGRLIRYTQVWPAWWGWRWACWRWRRYDPPSHDMGGSVRRLVRHGRAPVRLDATAAAVARVEVGLPNADRGHRT